MTQARHHGLNDAQLETLRRHLAPFADQIERVAVYGSRAAGTHRPFSDIDLVLYGSVEPQTVDRLFSQLMDSNLPVRVDVVAYERLTHTDLKRHIDQTAQELFSKKDL